MIKSQIDDNDVSFLTKIVNKEWRNFLLVQFVIGFIVSLFIYATRGFFQKKYVLLISIFVFLIWVYFWVLGFLKASFLKRNLTSKSINIVEKEFLVYKKDFYRISYDTGSDSYTYYLKLVEKNNNIFKKMSLSEKAYNSIKIEESIVLTYYDKFDILIEAKFKNNSIQNAKLILESELHLFKVLKKYS